MTDVCHKHAYVVGRLNSIMLNTYPASHMCEPPHGRVLCVCFLSMPQKVRRIINILISARQLKRLQFSMLFSRKHSHVLIYPVLLHGERKPLAM